MAHSARRRRAGRCRFAHDAERRAAGLVTEEGEILPEEATLAVACEIQLARSTGTVVTNVSTSAGVDAIAARYGGRVVRTPVGQAFVSEAMAETGAVIGGEGSGGVVVPRVHLTHDSAAAVGLILEHSRSRRAAVRSGRRLPRSRCSINAGQTNRPPLVQRMHDEIMRGRPYDQTAG